jgi:hypothetical protein
MDQQLLQKLQRLVDKGVFNKSVQDFGPSQNPNQLVPQRLYFIRVRQPGQPGIDTIVMYNNTKNNLMFFRQYYSRFLRMSEDDLYNPLKPIDSDINIPNQPDLYIVDITDIITNESRKLDKLNVAFLSSEQAGPNLLSNLPYGLAPNNGTETGTGEPGLVARYLGGKMYMKKKSKSKSKSTRKKRSKRRRHSKTKK